MKRLFAVLLCMVLLLGSAAVPARAGSVSAPAANVTDTSAPRVISVTFKENRKTLKPGDVVHVEAALDDRSDITYCYAEFSAKVGKDKEGKDLYRYIGLFLEYDPVKDLYAGEYKLRETDANAKYMLSYIDSYDEYSNRGDMSSDWGWFKLTKAGKFENMTVKLKENGKTVKAKDPVHVTVKPKKKNTEIDHVEVVLTHEATQSDVWIWCDYDEASGTFKGSYRFKNDYEDEDGKKVTKTMPNGKYSLTSYYAYDQMYSVLGWGNVTGQSVTLTGGSKDTDKPKISGVKLKERKKTLKAGAVLHVSAKVKDASEVVYVSAGIISADGFGSWDPGTSSWVSDYKESYWIRLNYSKSAKRWEGSLTLPKELPNGRYYINVNAEDSADNYTTFEAPKQYFDFAGDDFVTTGIKNFLNLCFRSLWNREPSEAELKTYGLPIAKGQKKAVDTILTLVKKANLDENGQITALYKIMQDCEPSSSQRSALKPYLAKGLENAIDFLNNAKFREWCKWFGINPGTLGTASAKSEVRSVDVAGGHYLLSGKTAAFSGVTDSSIKELVIQDAVQANGKTYKVTKIAVGACKGLKKLASVTIGKNVASIGGLAFAGCGKLKKIVVNTQKLKEKKVGPGCFSDIYKKATFKCPKKKKSSYQAWFLKNGGAPKKSKFQ